MIELTDAERRAVEPAIRRGHVPIRTDAVTGHWSLICARCGAGARRTGPRHLAGALLEKSSRCFRSERKR